MQELQLFKPDWDLPPQVAAFVTGRAGGVSKNEFASLNVAHHVGDIPASVDRNRAIVREAFPDATRWQWLDQVHGNSVHVVTEAGEDLQGDALVTREKGLACCVMTADCLPLFVASNSGDEIAIVHGGWRGLAAGIVENTIQAMDNEPATLSAYLGPAIGPDHFEVGPEVRAAFLALQDSAEMEQQFRPAAAKFYADLYGISRLLLAAAGVTHVSGGSHCTFRDADSFYSYRRDGQTGRMLNAIYIR